MSVLTFRWIIAFCLLFQAGCNIPFRSIRPAKLPADELNGPFYQASDYSIGKEYENGAPDSITVQYLGCGGLYIRKNEQAILVDPFFSYIKMLPGLKFRLRNLMWLAVLAKRNVKIKPHIPSVELGYQRMAMHKNFTQPSAILLTHGHYDHLLDVPYLYKTRFSPLNSPPVYGNLTTVNLLKDIIEKEKLIDLEPGMQNQHNTGTWITIGNSSASEHIRFMAIEADHAPHARSLKLFDGDGLNSVGSYAEYLSGTPINKWLEGRTLALLVDFMKGTDTVAYRIYIQTSACTPTRGGLPAALQKEKAVDLAIICVASFELVDQYPNLLLASLQPRNVMLVHWEDFIFKSYKRILRRPETIGFSDVREFMVRMQEIRTKYGLNYKYVMPAPGTIGFYRFNIAEQSTQIPENK